MNKPIAEGMTILAIVCLIVLAITLYIMPKHITEQARRMKAGVILKEIEIRNIALAACKIRITSLERDIRAQQEYIDMMKIPPNQTRGKP